MVHLIVNNPEDGPDLSDLKGGDTLDAMFHEIILRHCQHTFERVLDHHPATATPEDDPLIKHVTDLLARNLDISGAPQLRGLTGEKLDHLFDMQREAEARVWPASRRLAHKTVGDHALLSLGFFPEGIPDQADYREPLTVEDYIKLGRDSYLRAASIEPTDTRSVPSDQLLAVGSNFMLCAQAITSTRNRLFFNRDITGPL